MPTIINTRENPPNKQKIRKILVSMFVVIALVALGVSAWYWWNNVRDMGMGKDDQAVIVCGDDIVKRASPLIVKQDFSGLDTIAQEIRQKDNYQKDASCMYIIVRYQMIAGDAEGARESVKLIERVLSNKNVQQSDKLVAGYNANFEEPPMTPESMMTIIENIEQSPKRGENTFSGPGSEQGLDEAGEAGE